MSASSVRSSVRENNDFSDFQTTFFGGWQAPRDPPTGFLRSLWGSGKDSGEFWSGPADVAHQGALNLGYIIENHQNRAKISKIFKILIFRKFRKIFENFRKFPNFEKFLDLKKILSTDF